MSAIHDHAATCAALHVCTTPAYAAAALRCSRDEASAALREATAAGILRRFLLSGLGNTPCYQPTACAANTDSRHAPKFLRAGSSDAARWRGLLRGSVAFVAAPELAFLTQEAQAVLCEQHAIPTAGHAQAIVALDEGGRHAVFVPVLPRMAEHMPHGAISAAAARWLPLLERTSAMLAFVTTAGRAADILHAALSELVPVAASDARAELAAIDARIAADPTGVARLQLARQRAELMAAIDSASAADAFPWLARDVVAAEVRA